MHRKPWPIIVLTIIFSLIPLSNILTTFLVLSEKTTFSNYMYSLVAIPSNHPIVLNLLAPPIIATYAIYSVKKWSYPLLVISVLWIYTSALKNIGLELTTVQFVFSIIIPIIFGLVVLIYFLLPSVRQTYFDPDLKWWEAKPRFLVDLPFKGNYLGETLDGNIMNISEGGLLIKLNYDFKKNDIFSIKFKLEGYDLETSAKIIFNAQSNFGIQFLDTNESFRNQISDALRTLKNNNTKMSREPIPWEKDFKNWFDRLVGTGTGFTPTIPSQRRSTNKENHS